MYLESQIKDLAQLVAFTDTPELVQALSEQDESLASKVTTFHLEVVLLQTIKYLAETVGKASYADLRDDLIAGPFYGVPVPEMEKRIDKLLKGLTEKSLLDKEMQPTEHATLFLELVNKVFFSIQDSTTFLQENPH